MDNINYKNLYRLQDKILDIIFLQNLSFYLTGGTCLNRFYKTIRYSDDLDLFTNENRLFFYEFKEIIEKLKEKNIKFDIQIDAKDFKRVLIYENNLVLKLDLVNDYVKYINKPVIKNSYILDNLENIFANKITALISRDEPKDYVDIYSLVNFLNQDILVALKNAKEKLVFEDSDFLYRIQTFPIQLLDTINFIDNKYLIEIKNNNIKFINNLKNIILGM